MPDPCADHPATCPTCRMPARIRGGEGADPNAQVTLWYEPAVTPERLAALEAEHEAARPHMERRHTAEINYEWHSDWLKAWKRVEQSARPDVGEVRGG
jgi:hypothetical protein